MTLCSMCSARWPSARKFCARGRAEFPEILQFFRPIFAETLRDLDAGLALYRAFERTPTWKGAATKLCGLRNNAGRVHATSVRAARRKSSGNLQFFRASWAQILRDPDAGRVLSSDLNAMLTRSTINNLVQYAQRTMAECTQFLCAGACRISGNFAIFSPDFCANFA